MRFSTATVLAFAAAAFAQNPTANFDPITTPTQDENVPAGSTFEIDWEPSASYSGTVSIILLGGASAGTLEVLSTIASGVDNSAGKYEWSVSSTLGSLATYGIKIQLDSNTTVFQYSFPFHITGGSPSSSSSSGGASGSASASGSGSGSVTTTASSASSTSTVVVTTVPGNLSTTASPSKTTVTSIVSASKTTSSTTAATTGGAANIAAGSLAMLGGLALAAFAL